MRKLESMCSNSATRLRSQTDCSASGAPYYTGTGGVLDGAAGKQSPRVRYGCSIKPERSRTVHCGNGNIRGPARSREYRKKR